MSVVRGARPRQGAGQVVPSRTTASVVRSPTWCSGWRVL